MEQFLNRFGHPIWNALTSVSRSDAVSGRINPGSELSFRQRKVGKLDPFSIPMVFSEPQLTDDDLKYDENSAKETPAP